MTAHNIVHHFIRRVVGLKYAHNESEFGSRYYLFTRNKNTFQIRISDHAPKPDHKLTASIVVTHLDKELTKKEREAVERQLLPIFKDTKPFLHRIKS